MPTALLVAHHYPPHVGGLEQVAERHALSLAASGYEVIVLTSQIDSPASSATPISGVEVVRVSCSHILERRFFIPFPLFSLRLFAIAWRLLKRADFVHIHDVFYVSSWVLALLALFARRPLLLTQHVAMVEHANRLVMLMQKLVYATAGRWIFSRARSIVVYNENVRSFLLSRRVAEGRILRLANGIDTSLFRPAEADEVRAIRARYGLPLDRPLVLFVGRLVEKKGYQILLDAKEPGFDLVFVGPGNVPQHGRAAGVHWLGSREQGETAELYRACDAFAFPAVGEIFTLAMQEAMASGIAVVTTDDPAYHGSLVSGHVVLCARNAAAFAVAIRGLLADQDQLRRLGSRGRLLAVEHFDWQQNFKRMLAMYASVLSQEGKT